MKYAYLTAVFAFHFLLQNCTEKKPAPNRPLQAELLPTNAKSIEIKISNLNSWVEHDKFFVTGICSNLTSEWQKIWLEAVPMNQAAKPISIAKHSAVVIPTLSDAVPPNGRTSFFASWPLSAFSGVPFSCKVKGAGATPQVSGPILVVPMVNAMKMLVPPAPDQPATVEKAWQVSGSVSNPLPLIAAHPRLEVLIYGTDNRLWMSTLLNPEDPTIKQFFHFEREGPLQPNEDRPFTLQIFYEGLPQALQEKKLGRVEILPFEAR